jgi:hypothetical protein
MVTRLGKGGVDAFTILRIAGHSSITVSQCYVHPSAEAMERAIERLEDFRGRMVQRAENGTSWNLLPTVSIAVQKAPSVSH